MEKMEKSDYLKNQVNLALPEGKNFLVWLTHDVDRVYKTFFHALYYGFKEKKGSHLKSFFQGGNPYWNFEKIMELESQFGVRSTFFFLNETMKASISRPYSFVLAKGRYKIEDPKIQEMMKKLDEGGWEIGVHGSFHSYNNGDLLAREKETLEKILRHSISGIRQHHLNLEIPTTWSLQQSIGFQYDFSFGSNTENGYRDSIYYPFRPFKDDFVVFPLVIMDAVLFSSSTAEEAWNQCCRYMDFAQEKKTILSILWHQRVFNESDFSGYQEIYERFITECQKRNAQFCTGNDIFNYIDKS